MILVTCAREVLTASNRLDVHRTDELGLEGSDSTSGSNWPSDEPDWLTVPHTGNYT